MNKQSNAWEGADVDGAVVITGCKGNRCGRSLHTAHRLVLVTAASGKACLPGLLYCSPLVGLLHLVFPHTPPRPQQQQRASHRPPHAKATSWHGMNVVASHRSFVLSIRFVSLAYFHKFHCFENTANPQSCLCIFHHHPSDLPISPAPKWQLHLSKATVALSRR